MHPFIPIPLVHCIRAFVDCKIQDGRMIGMNRQGAKDAKKTQDLSFHLPAFPAG
jgi:hypothetical protein